MGTNNTDCQEATSVLATLRALTPSRQLSVKEALRIAELQAARLLSLHRVCVAPVPNDIVTDQTRITVDYDFDMPESVSGACHWDAEHRLWAITINGGQPETRQRFTLLHEYKHVLDHGHPGLRETRPRRYYGLPASEFIADYFAGCVLMPRTLVLRAWNQGLHHPADLAARFDVSERAMEVRLSQLKLTGTRGRAVGRHGDNTEEKAA